MPEGPYHYAIGKRKVAVAQVRLYPNGQGIITVNGKPANEYFTINTQMGTIIEPLKVVELDKTTNLDVRVHGGGTTGQAHAIRHAIARSLVELDKSFRAVLKRKGFLTRDARMVERKKPGLKKARRAPQWAKR